MITFSTWGFIAYIVLIAAANQRFGYWLGKREGRRKLLQDFGYKDFR